MRFKVVFIIVLMFLVMMSSIVFAEGLHGSHGSDATGPNFQARVGELQNFEGEFEKTDQTKGGPFEVQMTAVKVEDGAQILTMRSSSLDGSYKFAMQFFDGSEHEVTIQLINPSDKSILAEKKIKVEVEAFHPPMFIKIKTMAFLMLVIVIGMVIGVSLARLRKVNRELKGEHPNVI